MKKLLILSTIISLLACSNNKNDLTLSCYGTLLTTVSDKMPKAIYNTKTYKITNRKFEDYVCSNYENIIACDAVKDENGIRVRKRIIYDTKANTFAEITRTLDILNNDKADKTVIGQTEFIGSCQKPISL